MTGRFIIAALTVFLLLAAYPALAQDVNDGIIGTILEVQGSASVTPEGGRGVTVAAIDTPLHLNDVVQTGPESRIFILFIDNTELTLSENTQVRIDDYVFDPEESKDNEARYGVIQGAFQYVSGLIGKKENPDVQIETPVGTIGIRGTDFWAGNLDGKYSVAVNEGQVALKTDAGEEVVNKGEGTSVQDRRSRPDHAKAWSPEKLQRMAGTVRLQRRELVRQRIMAMQGRQQFLRNRYKAYMKAHRAGIRQEQRQLRREQREQNLNQNRGARWRERYNQNNQDNMGN